ncbi:Imm1 family immunity protein [Micromonospora sp. MS34]|uniref:Imm1 family immunity protein n=1 Tax=Micromonospora sp. MS34 TaxID=3385971 RepID=UPI0039A0D9CB
MNRLSRVVSAGRGEVWWEHPQGAVLGVVVGGRRALVLHLREPGDVGRHAVDPTAPPDVVGEYRLNNGQVDRYADRDTVEVDRLPALVAHFLAAAGRWPGVEWADDSG